jgi:glycosyltransferase involved in cell wall biosynthesis
MTDSEGAPSICFVGLANLPMLAPEYGSHGVGGAELQQTLLAKALARRGLTVSMVVADYGQADGAAWDGIKTYKAYRLDEGIPVLRFVHPRWTKLWAALRRADADIYYTMCAGGLLGQLAMFVHRHGRKLAFAIGSDTDCDPQALLVRFWRDRQLYRYGLKRSDVVLAQTADQRGALLRNFGRDSRVVEALSEPARRRRDFPERDIDVLWVANIRSLKRPERLLQLATRLPHLRFHMVGGPFVREHELFAAVRAEALTRPNVVFHGFVPYHDVSGLFERARVLVNTSEIEGFPNTYLQAWTHGAPVVTFIDPDAIISRNGLGRVAASDEEMSALVETLGGDSDEWNRASGRCRRYADARFSETRILAPYLEALGGALTPAQAVT